MKINGIEINRIEMAMFLRSLTLVLLMLIELKKIMTSPVSENELTRVKNKVESTMVFSEIDLSGRALNLAIAEYMGDAGLINTEVERYRSVTASEITERANEIFRESNCSTLYYLSKK